MWTFRKSEENRPGKVLHTFKDTNIACKKAGISLSSFSLFSSLRFSADKVSEDRKEMLYAKRLDNA